MCPCSPQTAVRCQLEQSQHSNEERQLVFIQRLLLNSQVEAGGECQTDGSKGGEAGSPPLHFKYERTKLLNGTKGKKFVLFQENLP